MSVSKKLRELRKNNNLTLRELGTELGISASTLGMYERGERNPKTENLIIISTYFGVDISEFDPSYEGLSKSELLGDIALKNEIDKAKRSANGSCQLCGKRAPFKYYDGEPYLEVSKIPDINYVKYVALCPNFNRKLSVLRLEGDIKYLERI